MDQVKKSVAAGVSFAAAVKDRLGLSTEQFAKKYRLNRTEFSMLINGRRVPDDKQLAALMKHMGGTRQEWLDLWFEVARRGMSRVGVV